MALTIHPAVCGTRRNWLRECVIFTSGATGGAFAAILLLTAAISCLVAVVPIPNVALGVVCAGIGLAALKDWGLAIPLPYRRGQVPEHLRTLLPRRLVALVFGLMLGFSFVTYFASSVQLAVFGCAALSRSAETTLAVSLCFAVGKSLPIVVGLFANGLDGVQRAYRRVPGDGLAWRSASSLASLAIMFTVLSR